MAILLKDADAYFLCHKTWSRTLCNGLDSFYKKVLFDITCPFLFDAQALKIAKRWDETREKSVSCDSVLEMVGDGEVFRVLSTTLHIIRSAKDVGLLRDANASDYSQNNRDARCFVRSFLESHQTLPLGHHISSIAHELTIGNHSYMFPENSDCYISDVAMLNTDLCGRRFDLIILDPPWRNKMVRRKRKRNSTLGYSMMDEYQLHDLYIGKLLQTDGIVAVWCTNSESLKTFIIENLFPTWSVDYCATWYWVKVTQRGEFTTPLGKDKKPYELIIFGKSTACGGSSGRDVPDKKVILSVPAAIHSFKPPLNEVLGPFLPESPKCLEIFARSLTPGWTSYGLEACKLQCVDLFEQTIQGNERTDV